MSKSRNRSRGNGASKGRDVNGFLLLDKPAGISSNGALQRAKFFLDAKKAGHTGSLDPIATGLLPLCFGETTKLSSFFLNADKRYVTKVRLGETTTTGDSEGEIITSSSVSVTVEDIHKALEAFRGDYKQMPPMFSAIKKDGQPLYKLARQGIEIEREPRDVSVYELTLHEFDGRDVVLEISCSRGFYVRSLAVDLGNALGVGGHVIELRRTGVGELTIDQSVTLEQLEAVAQVEHRDNFVLPSDVGLAHIPKVNLSVDATFYLLRGQIVSAARLPAEGWVRLYSEANGFLGLGSVTDDGRVAPKRLFQHLTHSASPTRTKFSENR